MQIVSGKVIACVALGCLALAAVNYFTRQPSSSPLASVSAPSTQQQSVPQEQTPVTRSLQPAPVHFLPPPLPTREAQVVEDTAADATDRSSTSASPESPSASPESLSSQEALEAKRRVGAPAPWFTIARELRRLPPVHAGLLPVESPAAETPTLAAPLINEPAGDKPATRRPDQRAPQREQKPELEHGGDWTEMDAYGRSRSPAMGASPARETPTGPDLSSPEMTGQAVATEAGFHRNPLQSPAMPELTTQEAAIADSHLSDSSPFRAINSGSSDEQQTENAIRPTVTDMSPVGHAVIDDQAPNPRAMEIVTQRADEVVKHGLSLASRNAPYSARREFTSALRSIAEALDTLAGGDAHERGLDAGLLALKEADDFISDTPESATDVAQIVEGHRTPILKAAGGGAISPLIARQKYYTFAQRELALAGGANPAAARALYGLGKLYTSQALQKSDALMVNGAKAMVFHRAALMIDPDNTFSANELGVLLARYGELELARETLLHCLRLQPMAEAWHNLAIVHERLGETDLAKRARVEFDLERRTRDKGPQDPNDAVQWVQPGKFNQMSRDSTNSPSVTSAARMPTQYSTPPNRQAR